MNILWLVQEQERRERELNRERNRPQIHLYVEDVRFYPQPERASEEKKETPRVIEIDL